MTWVGELIKDYPADYPAHLPWTGTCKSPNHLGLEHLQGGSIHSSGQLVSHLSQSVPGAVLCTLPC